MLRRIFLPSHHITLWVTHDEFRTFLYILRGTDRQPLHITHGTANSPTNTVRQLRCLAHGYIFLAFSYMHKGLIDIVSDASIQVIGFLTQTIN